MAPTTPHSARRKSRHRVALTVAGAIVGFGVVAVAIGDKWSSVEHALAGASLGVLAAATLLQLVSLLARSEAWHRCVHAAGGTVGRRTLFRAASVCYLGNLINGVIGCAMRTALLRLRARRSTPQLGPMPTTEVPI